MGKASPTGGVKPMSITGRLTSERERLLGMTDAERAFRKQWLKDQELAPSEPRPVPEIYKATYNPIRRLYRWPLDKLENALAPTLGAEPAKLLRTGIGKSLMGITLVYWMYYNLKYHSSEWERKGGVKYYISRTAVVPGDPTYPQVSNRSKGADYCTQGFQNVNLNL